MLLIVTRCDRCFSSGCMTGLNAKPEPAASGCQVSGKIPQGKYTVPKRNGVAAAFDCAPNAGVIASSIGSAIVAPKAPRRKVRRDRCFFVMIIVSLPWAASRPYSCRLSYSFAGFSGFQTRPHLKRRACNNLVNDRTETVSVHSRLLHDTPDDRHVRRFQSATQSVHHHTLGDHRGKGFRTANNSFP